MIWCIDKYNEMSRRYSSGLVKWGHCFFRWLGGCTEKNWLLLVSVAFLAFLWFKTTLVGYPKTIFPLIHRHIHRCYFWLEVTVNIRLFSIFVFQRLALLFALPWELRHMNFEEHHVSTETISFTFLSSSISSWSFLRDILCFYFFSFCDRSQLSYNKLNPFCHYCYECRTLRVLLFWSMLLLWGGFSF